MTRLRSIGINFFSLTRYNLRIIFGGRFVYFLLASAIIYLVIGTVTALESDFITLSEIYGLIAFPAVLLAFYPSVFGIQGDADQRTLEIIFGIPDYRYRVWLVRFFMIQVMVFLMLFPFAGLSFYLLISFPFIRMILHVMVLVLFTSSMGFCISTLVRNGNATAVIMVVFGLFFLIISDEIEFSKWNLFLSPFQESDRVNEVIFLETLRQNRLMLGISSLVFLLFGLLNLQSREKFLR